YGSPFPLYGPYYPPGTWAFSFQTSTWSMISSGVSVTGHSLIYDPRQDRVILFGGITDGASCNTGDVPPTFSSQSHNAVWELPLSDTLGWSQVTLAGISPAPRGWAAVALDANNHLIVFGGVQRSGVQPNAVLLRDTW